MRLESVRLPIGESSKASLLLVLLMGGAELYNILGVKVYFIAIGYVVTEGPPQLGFRGGTHAIGRCTRAHPLIHPLLALELHASMNDRTMRSSLRV